jgi:NAD(P)-dependent dehydrogenase (short-subunit alcohol dehydrogenase family)
MSGEARRVLVTGASAGIGRACAGNLHAAGWSVTGASRRGTAPGGWAGLVMDVDDDDSVRDGVAGMLAGGGRIDALVASAGWGLAGAVEQCTIGEAKAQLETNFWGCVRVVQQVLPAMRAQGAGRIVLISSIGGVIGIPFQAFYSASKFALEGLGEALAYEVAPFGVQVTLVQPGNIKTDFTASRRMAQAADGDPVYGAALVKAVGLMERDEANGAPAGDVAAAVRRVLEARRPPRRVSVGKAGERAGLLAKRLLPFRAFEAGAKGSLGVLAGDVVGRAGDHGEQVREAGQGGGLQGGGGHGRAARPGQLAGGGGAGHDRRPVAEVEGVPRGGVDAHVRHEPGEHQVGPAGLFELGAEVGLEERAREVLDDHRLARDGSDLVADLADFGCEVVGRSLARVVHDVEDRDARGPGAGQQAGRLGEGVLRAVQLHDAAPVGVLAVDHDQCRVRQRSRPVA